MDNQETHSWQLPLSLAISLQAQKIGTNLTTSDTKSLHCFDDVVQSALLKQDRQLTLSVVHFKKLQDIPLPATVKIVDTQKKVSMKTNKDNHQVAIHSYATIIEIDKANAWVVDGQGQKIAVPILEFQRVCCMDALVIRKQVEKIYSEQAIKIEEKHWFWSVFNKEYGVFSRVLIASFFANLLAILSSLFALQVYDRVIPSQSEETLWALLIGVLLAIGLEAVLRILRSVLLDYSGKRIDLQANSLLLRRMLRLRLSAESPSPSYLTQMMREFASVREFFTEAAVGSLVDIPFAFLFLFVIYLIGGNVVFVPIFAGVAMIVPALLMRKKMMSIVTSAQGSYAASARLCNEAAYNLENVKVTQSQDFFEKQWDDLNKISADVSTRQRKLVNALTQWSTSMQQLAYVMTITVATYAAFSGDMTMGTIIALNILVSRTLAPMTRLSTLFIRWAQVKSSLTGLEIIAKGEQDDPIQQKKLRRSQLSGLLELREVKYAYAKDTEPAIHIPRLTIRPGEKVAILGPNGSGKSTLLKLLSGMYFPQSGEIKCDNLDMRQISDKDLRDNINYFTQEVNLFNGTLRDNITFGDLNIDDSEIVRVLQQTGLGGLLDSHPHGLDLLIKDGGVGLSVGQKQSVQIARMLLGKHNVLLLDEPTASLDPNIENHLIHQLKNFSANKTLVVVTHRMPILTLVDRVIVVSNGRITLDGPKDEVLKRIHNAQQQTQESK